MSHDNHRSKPSERESQLVGVLGGRPGATGFGRRAKAWQVNRKSILAGKNCVEIGSAATPAVKGDDARLT
jgi:hypothetical protein